MTRHIALVPAAGVGVRFGADMPKQYVSINGQTVLQHTLNTLLSAVNISTVLVVVSAQDQWIDRIYPPHALPEKLHILRCGGATRAESVRNGLAAAMNAGCLKNEDWVLVHDAARCCLTAAALQRLITAADNHAVGGLLAVPVADTLKRADAHQSAAETVRRAGLWQAQTPQMFRTALLLRALTAADLSVVTDESSAIEALGLQPLLIAGDTANIKLTQPQDVRLAAMLLAQQDNTMDIRIGQGHDVHRLVAGRPLIIGGVTIPHHKGLLGHSDADVLLHAVTDALLGAAALGDIGKWYPDTAAATRDADSRMLLRGVYEAVQTQGWCVVNVDSTVIAQQPKLRPHIDAMRTRIAADLGLPMTAVSIKGKTNEQLGYLGREEAIEAEAVVLLTRATAASISGQ